MRLAGGEGLNPPVCTVVPAASDVRRATDGTRRTAPRKRASTRVYYYYYFYYDYYYYYYYYYFLFFWDVCAADEVKLG